MRGRISNEIVKFLNDNGYRVISKSIIGDETFEPFSDVPTRQEREVCIIEDYL